MSLSASDLRNLYAALAKAGDCASAQTLAQATGLSIGQVETGLRRLIEAELARNSQSCVGEIRFKTTE